MGHHAFGDIPKSQRWNAVVAAVAGGGIGFGASSDFDEFVEGVAQHTLDAAGAGLRRAVGDVGLSYTFYLLTQVVLAAREHDWRDRLRDHGLRLSERSDFFDLTSEVQRAIDEFVGAHGQRTEVSEMAQQAAGEALASLARQAARTLFGAGKRRSPGCRPTALNRFRVRTAWATVLWGFPDAVPELLHQSGHGCLNREQEPS